MQTLMSIDIPVLTLLNRGKVRDIYKVDDERLLFVATDRISAFDVVMPNGIPDKGRVLTQISLFWFEKLHDITPNHLITADVGMYPAILKPYTGQLEGRSMLVRRVKILPVECIVRGYLSGSGWKSYRNDGKVCGIELPPGLRESDRLPEPIFTPSTKAESGHDQNISFDGAMQIIASDLGTSQKFAMNTIGKQLKEVSIKLYQAAANYALTRGIIIADTKFEFGLAGDQLVITLADEALTPDSSRFWDVEKYKPGREQESFDKQFVRDYLETLDWNKEPPGPSLPDEIVSRTREKYADAYHRITGCPLGIPNVDQFTLATVEAANKL